MHEEFEFTSLEDLREMWRQFVAAGPPAEQDFEFGRRLAHEIAEREKVFGKGEASGRPKGKS